MEGLGERVMPNFSEYPSHIRIALSCCAVGRIGCVLGRFALLCNATFWWKK
jgi:hypothetical protein